MLGGGIELHRKMLHRDPTRSFVPLFPQEPKLSHKLRGAELSGEFPQIVDAKRRN